MKNLNKAKTAVIQRTISKTIKRNTLTSASNRNVNKNCFYASNNDQKRVERRLVDAKIHSGHATGITVTAMNLRTMFGVL